MPSYQVEIHEFSTGITPEKLADGKWVSRGFTGRYMNSTLENIPHAVERAIANKDFAVAEGASSQEPTAIGRQVEEWFVVAMVTRGYDEKGRGASFYRYFLTKSERGLFEILAFLKQQKSKGSKIVFDPFEHKQVNQPHRDNVDFDYKISARNLSSEINLPHLLDPKEGYSPEKVNKLATVLAEQRNQSIAWAFRVEALEQPHKFQVIYPTNAVAYQRIQQSLSSSSKSVFTRDAVLDEQSINTAIKTIINSSQAKNNAIQTLLIGVQTIFETLNESDQRKFWQTLFKGQGADNAIQQNVHSAQMVRLLTIRAIILPDAVLEFVEWLKHSSNLEEEQKQADISLVLQKQFPDILNSPFSSIKNSLFEGVDQLVKSVFECSITSEDAFLMLKKNRNHRSIWNEFFIERFRILEHDLLGIQQNTIINQAQFKSKGIYQEILSGLGSNYLSYRRKFKNPNYLALGKLLYSLKQPVLAAYCYQAGHGSVPAKIYDKAKQYSNRGNHHQARQPSILSLEREPKFSEKLIDFLENPLTIGVAIILLLAAVTSLLGPSVVSRVKSLGLFSFLFQEEQKTEQISKNDDNNDDLLEERGIGTLETPKVSLEQSVTEQEIRIEEVEKGINILKQIDESKGINNLERSIGNFDAYIFDSLLTLIEEAEKNKISDPKLDFGSEAKKNSESNLKSIEIVVNTFLIDRPATPQELEVLKKVSDYEALKESNKEEAIALKKIWIGLTAYYQDKKGLDEIDGDLGKVNSDTYGSLFQDILHKIENKTSSEVPDGDVSPNSL